MTAPMSKFWAEVEALAKTGEAVRWEPDGKELFIKAPAGRLEITSSGEFASVACGYLFIEDRHVATEADADFLLAVCDAVLAGRAKVTVPNVSAELLTRGYTTIWKA
ncbi:hypothetical protein [Brevundimonas sp.]